MCYQIPLHYTTKENLQSLIPPSIPPWSDYICIVALPLSQPNITLIGKLDDACLSLLRSSTLPKIGVFAVCLLVCRVISIRYTISKTHDKDLTLGKIAIYHVFLAHDKIVVWPVFLFGMRLICFLSSTLFLTLDKLDICHVFVFGTRKIDKYFYPSIMKLYIHSHTICGTIC
jgi:hypothetical protein